MRQKISRQLADYGLNLCALIPVSALAQRWQNALPKFGRLETAEQFLLLMGNAGGEFWAALHRHSGLPDTEYVPAAEARDQHPVDRFAHDVTQRVLAEYFDIGSFQVLYPILPNAEQPDCLISLQALGRHVGWHHDSPLGLGLHPEHGLWFAYRSLVLIDASDAPEQLGEMAQRHPLMTADHCAQCETQDCISACPAEALSFNTPPDLTRCTGFRMRPESICAYQCRARAACPMGVDSRYKDTQIHYHYTISLASLQHSWISEAEAKP